MRKLAIAGATALALTLAACGGKVGEFISAVTTPIVNPVSSVDIYRVKNVYAATLSLAADYRDYCWGRSFRALMADPVAKPVCQRRRAVVRGIQSAAAKAKSAIASAEIFVRDNPTVNAASAITAAWTAVRSFQSAVPSVR